MQRDVSSTETLSAATEQTRLADDNVRVLWTSTGQGLEEYGGAAGVLVADSPKNKDDSKGAEPRSSLLDIESALPSTEETLTDHWEAALKLGFGGMPVFAFCTITASFVVVVVLVVLSLSLSLPCPRRDTHGRLIPCLNDSNPIPPTVTPDPETSTITPDPETSTVTTHSLTVIRQEKR